MILIYAFSNQWGTNISRRTLSELEKIILSCHYQGKCPEGTKGFDFLPINSYPQVFFKKYIEFNNYSLIIGLGDGPRFSSKIRIETQAKNAYNDREIYPFSPIFIDLSLPSVDIYDSALFQISSSMGTYNCNWLAYKTQLNINQKKPDTLHLFLHLPRSQNATLLATQLFELLKNNSIL